MLTGEGYPGGRQSKPECPSGLPVRRWSTRSRGDVVHGPARTAELGFVQVCVGAAGFDQRLVAATFYDAAIFHDEDHVGVADGRQPAGDDEAEIQIISPN